MKYLFILICLSAIQQARGQDALKLDAELSVELKGQHLLAALLNEPIECINCPSGSVSDNPLHHFAIYSGVTYKGTLAGKHFFETGLFLEERSFSGGNNTLSNLVVFPKLKIGSVDSFRVKEHLLQYEITAGDFWDEDFSDLLRFYNIDFQGLQTRFGWNKFWVGFDVIGDLSRNIGFDLHEMYKFSIEYRGEKIRNVTSWSINELHDSPVGDHPVPRDYNFANFTKFAFSKSLELAGQIEVRSNKTNRAAIAVGGKISYQKEKMLLRSSVRYYQAAFNLAFKSFTPRYRSRSSYVGDQLYPLKNYYRPINQWALFTNYQNLDLLNWELYFNWTKRLYKKIHFTSEVDLNLIYDLTGSTLDYYPFYNIGISVNFLDNFILSITGTNKHMHLDTYFQTSYASKLPLLSYNFKMNLAKLPLKTIVIRY